MKVEQDIRWRTNIHRTICIIHSRADDLVLVDNDTADWGFPRVKSSFPLVDVVSWRYVIWDRRVCAFVCEQKQYFEKSPSLGIDVKFMQSQPWPIAQLQAPARLVGSTWQCRHRAGRGWQSWPRGRRE